MTSTPATLPQPRLLQRIVLGLFALALVLNFWAQTRGWNRSLRDAHEFRQHQTALTAFYFKKEGLKLAYETPVLGPPWSIPLEFPIYQGIVAEWSNLTGQPMEQAGRLINIFFFYAALPAVWLLLRRRLPETTDRLLVLTAILVCPILMFYSRTFMIESTALCFTVWFVVAFEQVLDRPRSWYLPAAWVLGTLAALSKVTTFGAAWIALTALVLERILARRRNGQNWIPAAVWPTTLALLAGIVPLVVGSAWVVYSDQLKAVHPYGQFITSASLRTFNMGTLAQRMTYEWWRGIGYIVFHQVLTWPGLIVLFGGLFFVAASYRRLALVSAACFTGGFLLFANLYYVHDYYFYASTVFLLTAYGIVSAGLLRSRIIPWGIALLLVIGGLAGEVYAYSQTYYSFFRRVNDPVPIEAEIIKSLTPPEEVFAGFGYDWNSLLPYYSQRRGIMPFLSHTMDSALLDRSIAQLGSRRLGTVIVTSYFRTERPFLDMLRYKLNLTYEPVLRTADADVYVRRDRSAEATRILTARADWGGARLNLKPDASSVVLTDPPRDLTDPKWAGRFPMTSPTPFLSKGPVEIGILMLEDQPVISTQAPTEIHIKPPTGSRSLEAIGGMVPASYTKGNRTPGVVLAVFEELPDGTRRMLFERLLTPLTLPQDRGDVVISVHQDKPFTGTLVFAYYAIPSGDVSYSWSYWKSISIK